MDRSGQPVLTNGMHLRSHARLKSTKKKILLKIEDLNFKTVWSSFFNKNQKLEIKLTIFINS